MYVEFVSDSTYIISGTDHTRLSSCCRCRLQIQICEQKKNKIDHYYTNHWGRRENINAFFSKPTTWVDLKNNCYCTLSIELLKTTAITR